jgi:hypothetical protein
MGLNWNRDAWYCLENGVGEPLAKSGNGQGVKMAFSEFETKRYERVVGEFLDRRRPPVHLRDKVDIGYRIERQSIEIFEIRPVWNDPGEKMEPPIAKATYVKSSDSWKVFWMRADMKWHGYGPDPLVKTLEEFLELVNEDSHGCFWG